jgi:hypothetical protein
MPQVVISSGMTGPDGCEDKLTEYLCDSPGCPNIASHVLGCVREIGAAVVVCDEHATPAKSNIPLVPMGRRTSSQNI